MSLFGTRKKIKLRYNNLNGTKLASSSYEKLLVILIDRDLSFDKHIKSLYRKAGQKLKALARISNYLTHDQKRLLLNSLNLNSVIVL